MNYNVKCIMHNSQFAIKASLNKLILIFHQYVDKTPK